MNTEKAMLQFLGYRVDQMIFNAKPGFDVATEPIKLAPSFSRMIQQVHDNEYEVAIGVKLEQENLPFEAKLSLTGRFRYEGPREAEEKMLKINAVAILYPYVRATLSMLTTLAGIPAVIIPTINLAKMFEQEDQHE